MPEDLAADVGGPAGREDGHPIPGEASGDAGHARTSSPHPDPGHEHYNACYFPTRTV